MTDSLREQLDRHRSRMVVKTLIGLAINGDLDAIRLIFDRLDGPAGGELRQACASTLHRDAALLKMVEPMHGATLGYGGAPVDGEPFRYPNEPVDAND